MITLIDSHLLGDLAGKLSIAPISIVRENLEMALLQELSQNPLSERLVFYGGTALRLAHRSPRYSEDLDFLMIKNIQASDLEDFLRGALRVSDNALSLLEVKEKRNTLFALINAKHLDLKHPFNLKVEIAKRKNGLESKIYPLMTPASALKPLIRVATLTSLKELKLKAIAGRQDPKDWFDLWYIRGLLKENKSYRLKFPFDEKEFVRELRRFLPRAQYSLIEQIAHFYEDA